MRQAGGRVWQHRRLWQPVPLPAEPPNPCKWNIRFRAKAGAVAHGHHFNKTHIHRILPGKLRQRKDLIIVKSANEHGIEFDLLKVSIQGRMKPLPEVIQTAVAGNVGILLRIQGIQAQV